MNRPIGAWFVSIAVAVFAGGTMAQIPQSSDDLFLSHVRASAEDAGRDDISAALAEIHTAIALDPNRSDGWYELGSLLGQAGDFEGAETALRRAIQLKPDMAKAHYSLALALVGNPLDKMDWDGAIAECRQVLKYEPDSAQALNLMGAGLSATGKPDEAIPVLEHALRSSPDSPEAHFNLGLALEGNGKLDEALVQYRAGIAAKGEYPEATAALGNLLLRMGKSADAEQELDLALRLNPDLTAAHYTMARLLRSLGRKSEAAVEFNETKDLTERPTNGVQSSQMSNRALEVAASGDMTGAVVLLQKAIALKPDYGIPHFNLGLILADTGDNAKSLEELVKAISLLPGQPKFWFEYGRVLERAKDYREARNALAWAARLSPSDAAIRAELASIEVMQPSVRDASASEVRPPHAGAAQDTVADHLAFALELKRSGDLQGGVGELLRSLTLRATAVEPRRELAESYAQLGDSAHAILEYFKILRITPDDVGIRMALGGLLESRGDLAGAANQFRKALSSHPDLGAARAALARTEKALSIHP